MVVDRDPPGVHHRRFTRALLVSLLAFGGAAASAGQPLAEWTIRDQLRRDWCHELVFFPVSDEVFGRDDVNLLGPDGESLAYQWVSAERTASGEKAIAFCASVPAFGRSKFRLVLGPAAQATDLRIAIGRDQVELQNRLMGVRLGGPEARDRGPIDGVRLPSGRWVGGGRLIAPSRPVGFSVAVVARGPVFADVLLSYAFAEDRFWRLTFRMISGEPVVLVDEEFALPDGSRYAWRLADGWSPDAIFYRDNGNTCRLASIAELPDPTAFVLRAWPTWWSATPEAHWVAFCERGGDDLLAIGCREPGVWVQPGRTAWDAAVPIRKSQLEANLQLRGFRRKWMLAALRKSDSVPEQEARVSPLPQQYLIRHGDVSLDRVKDYILRWDDGRASHPSLFLTPGELARFRKRFPVDPEVLDKLRKTEIYSYRMDEFVAYFLATGDVALGRKIAARASELVQGAVDGFVLQNRLRNQGSCPHHRTPSVMGSAILGDLALTPGILPADRRARLKAQLAFLGYTLASPTFHSPERGYRANPNMTTSARGMLGLVACCIHDHPRARQWAQLAAGEIRRELDAWCGPGGGWLEAPHYMTVSMDAIVSVSMALRHTGYSDTEWLYDPKLKSAMAWLAKISTPPDPRLNGHRHMPAIGNTYLGERTCLPGWAAWIWRERDPAYAQHMQWMWRQQGSARTPGIGGAYPGLQGYGAIVLDATIPARPPQWRSEQFPAAGAVFRAHFPGDRETYLHYIQGAMHQHYDYDEGSFILWGKGRPLCEDFGYYGRAPAADHSRVDDGVPEYLGNEGRIGEFAAGDVDYLRGQRGGWHRQILFVKDEDPLGPNYFVIRDSVLSGRDADWRVWIATDRTPGVGGNPIRAAGRFDTDLVVFFAAPARPVVGTEAITRRCGASGFASRESTQRCLAVKMPSGQAVAAVLYPVLKDQTTPKFHVLADGRAVKIESAFGTDYAMLGLERFRLVAEGMEFEGIAGAVQVRPKGVRLALPRRGTLSYQGKAVENGADGAQTVSRWFR